MVAEGSPVMPVAGHIVVARVEADHLPALAEFYRQVWDPDATPDRVRASRDRAAAGNPVTPGQPPPTWLVLRDGRAIGHVTTIPVLLWFQDRPEPAYWIKGLWVLPEFQRSSVGFLALRAAAESVHPALAIAHEPAALRLFGALGFADLGSLPNDLRIVNARRVLSHVDLDALGLEGISRFLRPALRAATLGAPVFGPLVHGVTGLWATLATGPLGRHRAEAQGELDRAGAESLWRSVRREFAIGVVRDSARLAERYQDDAYTFIHVRHGPQLAGLAVVKAPRPNGDPRLRDIRVATLADLLYPPGSPRTGLAVLRGAERAARALGADALLCSASPAALRPLLRRRGYLRLPGNLHVLARFPGAKPPPRLEDWWVTRGDSGADGVF